MFDGRALLLILVAVTLLVGWVIADSDKPKPRKPKPAARPPRPDPFTPAERAAMSERTREVVELEQIWRLPAREHTDT